MTNSENFAVALIAFAGTLQYHLSSRPVLQFLQLQSLIFPSKYSYEPLNNAHLIFTDGSSNGKAAAVIDKTKFTSAQKAEIFCYD